MSTLTIFTPSYNRGYILGQLYHSLLEQTCMDFEWVIVDDGSTDNTKDLVQAWTNEGKLTIRYIYQENGGKIRAHNTGVLNTTTELFLCVDSDDYLVETAVEEILICWEAHRNVILAGIVAYRGVSPQQPMGTIFPVGGDTSTLSGLYKQGFKGETSLIYRTEILKAHLFPETEGEKFITEDFIYDQIDQECHLFLLSRVIIICCYLDDGYTKNYESLFEKNFQGWALYYNQKALFSQQLKQKMYYTAEYIYFCKLAERKTPLGILRAANQKICCFVMYFPALYLMFKRNKRG